MIILFGIVYILSSELVALPCYFKASWFSGKM